MSKQGDEQLIRTNLTFGGPFRPPWADQVDRGMRDLMRYVAINAMHSEASEVGREHTNAGILQQASMNRLSDGRVPRGIHIPLRGLTITTMEHSPVNDVERAVIRMCVFAGQPEISEASEKWPEHVPGGMYG